MHFKHSLVNICLFLLLACPSMGQGDANTKAAGTIAGMVRDSETGAALTFAHIALEGTAIGTTSLTDGTFRLENVPPGTHRIMVTSLGYASYLSDSFAVDDKIITQNVNLNPAAHPMREVTVTASRKSQSVSLTAASVTVVGREDIQDRNVTTFDQAVDNIPGVNVTRSSGANVQAISIRGASEVAGGGTGNRVLLLIDGRPALSPESGGALWNLVPVSSIQQIEVVRGPFSSLYGSSAVGGVIHVITKSPGEKPVTNVDLNYGLYENPPPSTEYNQVGFFHNIELSHSQRIGKISLLLDAARKSNDGHREKSAFTLTNLYGKANYSFAPNRSLQLSLNHNLIDNDTPATWLNRRLAYHVAQHRLDDFQKKREYSADIQYEAIPNSRFRYSSRLYYYQQFSLYTFDDDPDNDSTNVNLGKQIIDRETIRAERLGNLTQFDISLDKKHYMVAGFELKRDRIVALPDTVLYGRHTAFGVGLFLQDEITLNEKVLLTAGVRLDYYSIGQVHKSLDFSPKLSLLYTPLKQISFRVLMAQAFRNPAIAERFIKFEQGGGLRFRPNPDLRSERLVFSAEVGAKFQLAESALVDIAFFRNRYSDLISFQQLSQPTEPLLFEVINLKDALMQGAEFTFQFEQDNYRFQLGYTFLDARDISDGRVNDVLAYKVKHNLAFSAAATCNSFQINLDGNYRSAVHEVFIYPGSEPGGRLLLNGRISYTFSRRYTLYAAIGNITNRQYEELERYRMPGRNYTLGVRADF